MHDDYLLHGEPSALAAFLGVTRRTLNRYKQDPAAMPEACKKLLRLRLDGDLRALGGDDWEHFRFSCGQFYIPGWRNGFGPDQVRAMFFQVQEVAALRNQVKALQNELWALNKVRSYTHSPISTTEGTKP